MSRGREARIHSKNRWCLNMLVISTNLPTGGHMHDRDSGQHGPGHGSLAPREPAPHGKGKSTKNRC
eukprot:2425215-Karenia_brevis.AAC.1